MIDTSEKSKVAAKTSFLYTLALTALILISNYLWTWQTTTIIGLLGAFQILLYFILHLGLDLETIKKQNKKLLRRNP